MSDPSKEAISAYFRELQHRICLALEEADGQGHFAADPWERPGGGGGYSRVMQGGAVIEKGGVGFSAVHGESSEAMLKQLKMTEKADFHATGVSIVIHPHSPRVPIIHMNVRYFELGERYWFGGGIDLTPHYVVEAEGRFFHAALKQVCDAFHPTYYERFKKEADDYFFIRHRQEMRGIGGIFFDYLHADQEMSKAHLFDFVKAVAERFVPIYTHFMTLNREADFGERERQWQLLRRGRYAEFNLVYDRGTRFGLETDGRTESILMSLPPLAAWNYNVQPEAGSPEATTLEWLRKGIKWA